MYSSKGVMATSVTMCAIFRLVRILRWITDEEDFETINAVLGCPVFMPEGLLDINRGVFVSMSDPLEQKCVLHTLFILVNWFRELVNAFCVAEELDLKEKVVDKYIFV
jgi:fanconi anemia group D2 protein